jgi:hypothetical protein
MKIPRCSSEIMYMEKYALTWRTKSKNTCYQAHSNLCYKNKSRYYKKKEVSETIKINIFKKLMGKLRTDHMRSQDIRYQCDIQ